jgi:two-component system, OmpR family, sensor histidine kinase MprB
MNLRARLAAALATLAALSVVAVAAISYAATDQRLHDEVDAGLVDEASQLAASGVETVGNLCGLIDREDGPMRAVGAPIPGVPGDVIQCVDPAGRVVSSLGPPGVRVDSPGIDVTARPGHDDKGSRSFGPYGNQGDPQPNSDGGLRPWTQVLGGQRFRVVAIPWFSTGEVRVGRSLAETDRILTSVRASSAAVGLLIIALAAAGGMLLARHITRPVTRLTDAAEAIAASGRLDIAMPTGDRSGRDEIGRLAQAFASMLAALTRSRDQQQRLVQDAGHELRTPLTSLRANIDTLRRHPELAAAPRARLLADLDGELRELSGLVDELVALAVDRHDDEPERTVALDSLAERAADRSRRRSGREIVVDAKPATVVARHHQLLRALSNLIDNAVKFSPDGSPVEVTVRPGRVQVRDHGPGIADEDLPRVFDRFYRALDARSLAGFGLGLAIVRQIVEEGGGSVQAANHPDGGAVFTIEWPRSQPA